MKITRKMLKSAFPARVPMDTAERLAGKEKRRANPSRALRFIA